MIGVCVGWWVGLTVCTLCLACSNETHTVDVAITLDNPCSHTPSFSRPLPPSLTSAVLPTREEVDAGHWPLCSEHRQEASRWEQVWHDQQEGGGLCNRQGESVMAHAYVNEMYGYGAGLSSVEQGCYYCLWWRVRMCCVGVRVSVFTVAVFLRWCASSAAKQTS